jgi:hypothetical protein
MPDAVRFVPRHQSLHHEVPIRPQVFGSVHEAPRLSLDAVEHEQGVVHAVDEPELALDAATGHVAHHHIERCRSGLAREPVGHVRRQLDAVNLDALRSEG